MPEPPFPQDEEVSPSNPFLDEEEVSRRDTQSLERALDMLMVTTSRRCSRMLGACDIQCFAGHSKNASSSFSFFFFHLSSFELHSICLFRHV